MDQVLLILDFFFFGSVIMLNMLGRQISMVLTNSISVCHIAAYKIHFKLHYVALDATGKFEYNKPRLDSGEFRFGN